VAARQALRASQPGLGLVLVAVAGLLASPISWAHHWVWCVPALLILADLGRVHRVPRWLAITGVVLFLTPAYQFLPFPADHWALWQQAADAGYALWALLLLTATVIAGHQWSRPTAQTPSPSAAPGASASKPALP